MKKKFFLAALFLVLGMGVTSYAQISEGKPTSKVFRTGNRPQKGDWGLFFGMNIMSPEIVDMGIDIADIDIDNYKTFLTPALNIKYFITDRFELRVGLEAMRNFAGSKSHKKEVVDINRGSNYRAAIYPGFAYHFSPKNILDVYVGAELPLGYNGSVRTFNSTAADVDGEIFPLKRVTRGTAFNLGLNAFVGLQVFIADLPIALGVEYGLGAYMSMGDKVRISEQIGNNDPVVTYKYSSSSSESFDKLSRKHGAVSDQVRVTLSYYFK